MNIEVTKTSSNLDSGKPVEVTVTYAINSFEELRTLTNKVQDLSVGCIRQLLVSECVKQNKIDIISAYKFINSLISAIKTSPLIELYIMRIIAISMDSVYPDNIKEKEDNIIYGIITDYSNLSEKFIYSCFPAFRTEEQLKFAKHIIRKLKK